VILSMGSTSSRSATGRTSNMRASRLVLILAAVVVGTVCGLIAGLTVIFWQPEPVRLEERARPAGGVVWRV
jgi:ribose/xylose/arabinose/galactoside ABC-type transport system permease subunit